MASTFLFSRGFGLEMTDFHSLTVLSLTPHTAFFSWLPFIEINLRATLAIISLVGEIVAANTDIFAKTNFGICWHAEHCQQRAYQNERERLHQIVLNRDYPHIRKFEAIVG